jgi:T-complex protein 1 subunit beta
MSNIFFFFFVKTLPTVIADNAGFDSAELISQLKAHHNKGDKTYGLRKKPLLC